MSLLMAILSRTTLEHARTAQLHSSDCHIVLLSLNAARLHTLFHSITCIESDGYPPIVCAREYMFVVKSYMSAWTEMLDRSTSQASAQSSSCAGPNDSPEQQQLSEPCSEMGTHLQNDPNCASSGQLAVLRRACGLRMWHLHLKKC